MKYQADGSWKEGKDLAGGVMDELWAEARLPLAKKVKIKTDQKGKKSIVGRGAQKAKTGGKDDDLHLNQFIDACLRLTNLHFPPSTEEGGTSSITSRFNQCFSERFQPLLSDFSLEAYTFEEGTLEELRALPAVQEVLTKNHEKLKKYHK